MTTCTQLFPSLEVDLVESLEESMQILCDSEEMD